MNTDQIAEEKADKDGLKKLSQLAIDYKSRSGVNPFLQFYLETGINPYLVIFLSKIKTESQG